MEKCQPVLTVLLHHLHQPIRRFLWVVTRGFSFPEQKMRHSKVHGIVYNYSGEAVKASIIINLSAYFPSFFAAVVIGKREVENCHSSNQSPLIKCKYILLLFMCVYPVLPKKKLQIFSMVQLLCSCSPVNSINRNIFFWCVELHLKKLRGLEYAYFQLDFSRVLGSKIGTRQMPLNVC